MHSNVTDWHNPRQKTQLFCSLQPLTERHCLFHFRSNQAFPATTFLTSMQTLRLSDLLCEAEHSDFEKILLSYYTSYIDFAQRLLCEFERTLPL